MTVSILFVRGLITEDHPPEGVVPQMKTENCYPSNCGCLGSKKKAGHSGNFANDQVHRT